MRLTGPRKGNGGQTTTAATHPIPTRPDVPDSPKALLHLACFPAHLPVPHALVVQNPRPQAIELQTSDPAVVRHPQLAENAPALPHYDRGIEVFRRRRDQDFFRVLRQRLPDLELEVGAQVRRFGGAADHHDAAEQVAAAALVVAGCDVD